MSNVHDKNIKLIYDKLTSKGVDMGTLEETTKALRSDPRNGRLLYDMGTKHGYDMGSYEEFEEAMGLPKFQAPQLYGEEPIEVNSAQPKAEEPKQEDDYLTSDMPEEVEPEEEYDFNREVLKDYVPQFKNEIKEKFPNARLYGFSKPVQLGGPGMSYVGEEAYIPMEDRQRMNTLSEQLKLGQITKEQYENEEKAIRQKAVDKMNDQFSEDTLNASAALHLMNQAQKRVKLVDGRTKSNIVSAFRGVAHYDYAGLNPSLQFIDAYRSFALLNKVAENPDAELSESEQYLLQAIVTNNAVNDTFQTNMAERIGQGLPDSMALMAQFLLTGGVGGAVGKLAKEGIEKVIKKGLKNATRRLYDDGFKGLAQKGLDRTVNTVIPGVVGATTAAATQAILNPAGLASGTYERAAGTAEYTLAPDGTPIATGEVTGRMDLGEAFAKEFAAQTFELLSERAGASLGIVTGAGKAVVKTTGKAIASKVPGVQKAADAFVEFADNMKKTKVGDLVGKAAEWLENKDLGVKALAQKVGWNGTIEEWYEEQADTILKAMFVGDEELSALFNGERQLETFLSVAVVGGATRLLSAPVAIEQRAEVRKEKQNLKNTISDIEKRVQGNSAMSNALKAVATAVDTGTVEDVAIAINEANRQLNLDTDTKRMFLDYASARMMSNMWRSNDRRQASKLAEGVYAEVEARTHKQSGTITVAEYTDKDGNKQNVDIIDGVIIRDGGKKIDSTLSDRSVVVRMQDGTTQMVPSKSLGNIVEEINPAQYRAKLANASARDMASTLFSEYSARTNKHGVYYNEDGSLDYYHATPGQTALSLIDELGSAEAAAEYAANQLAGLQGAEMTSAEGGEGMSIEAQNALSKWQAVSGLLADITAYNAQQAAAAGGKAPEGTEPMENPLPVDAAAPARNLRTGDRLRLTVDNGEMAEATIGSKTSDGNYLVDFDDTVTIGGKKGVSHELTPEVIAAMQYVEEVQEGDAELQAEQTPEQDDVTSYKDMVIGRIPMKADGSRNWEAATPAEAAQAINAERDGDFDASIAFAQQMAQNCANAVAELTNAELEVEDPTNADMVAAAEAQRAQAIASMQKTADFWSEVTNILNTANTERAKPTEQETPVEEETPTPEDAMPMIDEDTPDFVSAGPERSAEFLSEQFGDDAESFIQDNIAEAQKALADAQGKKPKSTNFAERKKENEAIAQEKVVATAALDFWNAVGAAYAARQSAAPAEEVAQPEVVESAEQPATAVEEQPAEEVAQPEVVEEATPAEETEEAPAEASEVAEETAATQPEEVVEEIAQPAAEDVQPEVTEETTPAESDKQPEQEPQRDNFEEAVANQGYIERKPAKSKFSVWDFVAGKEVRPSAKIPTILEGVYYDKGFRVASDGKVLVKEKNTAYPAEYEGTARMRDGARTDEGVKYPPYERVIPAYKQADSRKIDFADLLGFLNAVKERVTAEHKATNQHRSLSAALNNTPISMRLANGQVVSFSLAKLMKFALAAKQIGVDRVYGDDWTRAILAKNKNGELALLIPVRPDVYPFEGSTRYYYAPELETKPEPNKAPTEEAEETTVTNVQTAPTEEAAEKENTPTETTEEPTPTAKGDATTKIEDFGEKIGGARKDVARQRIKDSMAYSRTDLVNLKDPDKILSRANIIKYVREGEMTIQDATTLLALNMAVRGEDLRKGLWLEKYRDAAFAWSKGQDVVVEVTDKDVDEVVESLGERARQRANIRQVVREGLELTLGTYTDYKTTYEALNYPEVNRMMKSVYIRVGRHDGKYWVVASPKASRGWPYATMSQAVAKMQVVCPVIPEEDSSKGKEGKDGKDKIGHLHIVKDERGYYRIKSRNIPGSIYLSKRFNSKKVAEQFLQDNAQELVQREIMMTAALMGSNIGMVERQGPDYRNGRDVTPQDFLDTFGVRGVEFGNWVPQAERQLYLNKSYDAIMDLCKVVGISPKAFSLGGRLALAFGSRGKSRALAHYEPLKEVINLTRMKGAGSLAHEWFHALDNYLSRQVNGNVGSMTTRDFRTQRSEVAQEFRNFVHKMGELAYSRRSSLAGPYWYEVWERAARLFESYVYNKLAEQNIESPLLVVKDTLYDESNPLMGESGQSAWPYPSAEENEEIKPFFDTLFDTIQEREENGKAVLYQIEDSDLNTAEAKMSTEEVLDLVKAAGIEVEIATPEMVEEMLEMQNALMEAKMKSVPETVSVQDEHQPTVVSSTDGAKVLNNLDNLQKEYQEKTNRPLTFIGDVAKAIRAKREKSDSEYATFEAVNGNIVTIRLSDHSATTKNFDIHNETEGISLVISAQPVEGIDNTEGKAHIVEFYYNSIELRRADGKPLVEIIKSIKQALYSGEYTDNTGLAKRQEVNEPQWLRTTEGEVYGWVANGKIYLTEKGLNPETPIHEYTHIWDAVCQRENPKLWAEGVALMKQTPLWEQVRTNPAYADIADNENALASEVHARLAAPGGTAILVEIMEQQKAEATLIGRIHNWLRKFWRWLRKKEMPESKLNVDKFARMPLKDLAMGKRLLDGIASANGKQKVAGQEIMDAFGDVPMAQIGRRRQEEMYAILAKRRQDLSDAEKLAVIAELDKLDNNKLVNAAFHYFVNGTVRLPEDMPKVEQAVKVAEIAKVDPAAYKSPMELINAHADVKLKEARIDPDTVPTLSNKVEYEDGLAVYDVEESEESRQNMRRIINTHFGEDSSPWCLLQGDGQGNLTDESARYWIHYDAQPKRVAFQNGKLLAFFASDGEPTWWDRKDAPHEGIPATRKLPDNSGRVGTVEFDEEMQDWGDYTEIHLGKQGDKIYEEWIDEDTIDFREIREGDTIYHYSFDIEGMITTYMEKNVSGSSFPKRSAIWNEGNVESVTDENGTIYDFHRGNLERIQSRGKTIYEDSHVYWAYDGLLRDVSETTEKENKRVWFGKFEDVERVEVSNANGIITFNMQRHTNGEMASASMLDENGVRTFVSFDTGGGVRQYRVGDDVAFMHGNEILEVTAGMMDLAPLQILVQADKVKKAIEQRVSEYAEWAKQYAAEQAQAAESVREPYANPEDFERQMKSQLSAANVRHRTASEEARQRVIAAQAQTLSTAEIEEYINEVAKSLPEGVKVVVTNSTESGDREHSGWYDMGTDTVYINADMCDNTADVDATIVHELVGHRSMPTAIARVIGRTNATDRIALYTKLATMLPKELLDRVMAKTAADMDLGVAVDEVLAEAVENADLIKPSVWQRICSEVRAFFRRVFNRGISLSDGDIKYMFWLAAHNINNDAEFVAAEGILHRLGAGRFKRNSALPTEEQQEYDSAVISKSQQFVEEWVDSLNPLKTLQEIVAKHHGELKSWENAYDIELGRASRTMARSKMMGERFLKPLITAISAFTNNGISREEVNYYMIAKHGLERNEYFRNKRLRELNAQINEFAKEVAQGYIYKDMSDTEKAAIVKRQFIDYESFLNMDEVVKALEWYVSNDADYMGSAITDIEAIPLKDESGLTGLAEVLNEDPDAKPEEIFTEVAEKLVEEFEGENGEAVNTLWDKVRDLTNATLLYQTEGGILSQEQYQNLRSMYRYYIPLRGWAEETSDAFYEYPTGDARLQTVVTTAQGRKSLAEDPIAHMANMLESAVFITEKNAAKQALVRMALNRADNSLLRVVKMRYVKTKLPGGRVEWTAQYPTIPEKASQAEVDAILAQFDADTKAMVKAGTARVKRTQLDVGVMVKPKHIDAHFVKAMINGEEVAVIINANPAAAIALNGDKTKKYDDQLKKMGALTRFYAKTHTTWAPKFVVTNFLRDWGYSSFSAYVRYGARYAARFEKNILKWKGMIKMMAKDIHNITEEQYNDPSLIANPTLRYFVEFLTNGGETGFSTSMATEEWKKEIDKQLSDIKGSKLDPRKAVNAMLNFLEFANRYMEDVPRFAAYLTSREMGKNVAESIKDAKEITVNFSRHGAGGGIEYKRLSKILTRITGKEITVYSSNNAVIRKLYAFANAGIQGLYNLTTLAKEHPKRFYPAVGTIFLSGFAIPLLNGLLISLFGDDEDEQNYRYMTEFNNTNRLVLFNPFDKDGGFITLPISQSLVPFYGLGNIFSRRIMGYDADLSLGGQIASTILAASPLSFISDSAKGLDLAGFAPSFLQPIADVAINRDFMGRPIFRSYDYGNGNTNKGDAAFTKAPIDTWQWLVWLSKQTSRLTGGDGIIMPGWADFNIGGNLTDLQLTNPAIAQYLLESYLGGALQTTSRFVNLGKGVIATLTGDETRAEEYLAAYNLPLISGLYRFSNETSANSRIKEAYDHYKNDISKQCERAVKTYMEELPSDLNLWPKAAIEVLNSTDYQIYQLFKDYDKPIRKAEKLLNEAYDRKAPKAEIDELKRVIMAAKMELIEAASDIQLRGVATKMQDNN